eukprot:gene895-194_t
MSFSNVMENRGRRRFGENQALNGDYELTGFDRGHLNPNFYQCTEESRSATFTLTNGVPQDACFNQILWHEMEKESKKIMEEECSFQGAQRFFVTGTIPSTLKIPFERHDQGSDRQREHNRVTIPSHMWTAACCDSTNAVDQDDKEKGFSFGYIGRNKPYAEMKVSVVEQLEREISYFRESPQINNIFQDNYCNLDDDLSNSAVAQLTAVVTKHAIEEEESLSMVDPNSLPLKRRRMDDRHQEMAQLSQIATIGKTLYFDFTTYVYLPKISDEVIEYRKELADTGYTVILVATYSVYARRIIHSELRARSRVLKSKPAAKSLEKGYHKNAKKIENLFSNKPQHTGIQILKELTGKSRLSESKHAAKSGENMAGSRSKQMKKNMAPQQGDTYMIVPIASRAYMTVSGDYCRRDHVCDFHGEESKWCYIDDNNNRDFCCEDACTTPNYETHVPQCLANKVRQECSMRVSAVHVKGGQCREDHECGLHGQDYYWCYTTLSGDWEYCCQPWDICKPRRELRHCSVGKHYQQNMKPCFY